jgi:hypothetical protein
VSADAPRLERMPLNLSPRLPVKSHGIARKTITLVLNVPCFSVCFRGRLQARADDSPGAKIRAIALAAGTRNQHAANSHPMSVRHGFPYFRAYRDLNCGASPRAQSRRTSSFGSRIKLPDVPADGSSRTVTVLGFRRLPGHDLSQLREHVRAARNKCVFYVVSPIYSAIVTLIWFPVP